MTVVTGYLSSWGDGSFFFSWGGQDGRAEVDQGSGGCMVCCFCSLDGMCGIEHVL